MKVEYVKYKGIIFPVRVCNFVYGKKTITRKIGSEVMSGVLLNEDTYCDDEAKYIDEQIAYFVPHDELLKRSDKEMLNYIYYNLDECILEDFED